MDIAGPRNAGPRNMRELTNKQEKRSQQEKTKSKRIENREAVPGLFVLALPALDKANKQSKQAGTNKQAELR